MTSKIRIRAGRLEVEYEGSEDFMRDDLPKLLETVDSLSSASQAADDSGEDKQADTSGGGGGNGKVAGSTATLAAKLKVESGPALILAAAARLTLGEGQASFNRKQLTDEMKTATGYYKKTYMNNMSSYLQNLVKEQKLVEPSSGTYALSSTTRATLEQRFAQ